MRLFLASGNLLVKLKSRLPLNGDWLFVTASFSDERQIDTTEGCLAPSFVLARLSGLTTLEAAKAIYERVKSYESTVGEIADRIYDREEAPKMTFDL